jgi:VanZ family protein
MQEMEREGGPGASAGRRGPAWLWAVWALYLAVWTAALLRPEPARVNTEVLPERAQFPAAKALHVGSYALLAALACWLPVRPGRRWLLFAALSLHAFGTEYLQRFVELRTGSLTDVGIDHVGIAIGLLAAWCVSSARVFQKWPTQATEAGSLAGTCGRYCAGRSHVHASSASPAPTSRTLE